MTVEMFKGLLEFIYSDQLNLRDKPDLALELIDVAEQYALPRLKVRPRSGLGARA